MEHLYGNAAIDFQYISSDWASGMPLHRDEANDTVALLGLVEADLALALVPASSRRVVAPDTKLRRLPWLSLSFPFFVLRRADGGPLIATRLANEIVRLGSVTSPCADGSS